MNWETIIENEQKKKYFKKLQEVIDTRYQETNVYPEKNKIFHAFTLTPIEELKVVILGQDPYHQPFQAQGLAFSTPKELKNPPSMVNILKEIESEYTSPSKCLDGDLTPWAKQGILLINTILTVEDSKSKSHHNIGWEIFTDNIIEYISNNCESIVFLLWGSNAISKQKLIDKNKHFIFTAPHPSPLSAYRGFFGCDHFKKTNEFLVSIGKTPIKW